MNDFLQVTDWATKSLKWVSAIEILSRVSTPVVFIVVATLLRPSDFGLAAAASLVVSFVQILVDTGLGPGLILTKSPSLTRAANTAFYLNLLLGVLLYAVIALSAPLVAAAFHESSLIVMIRVLGLQVLFAASANVQECLLERDFGFKSLLVAKLAAALVSATVSISLALLGFGAWSLIWGYLTSTAIYSAVVWIVSPWKPALDFDSASVGALVTFGSWITLEGFVTWILLWADNLIVGSFLGVEQLGIYRLAGNIASVLFTTLFNPLLVILYPYLSRLNADAESLRDVFTKLNRLVSALALPMAVGLVLTAPALALIFESRWMGLGVLLSLASLREGISWFAGLNPGLYRALGRPQINVKVIVISVCVGLPCYLVVVSQGLYVFALVRIVLTIGTVLLHVFFITRLLGLRSTYLWDDNRPAAIACFVMGATVLAGQSVLMRLDSLNPVMSTAMIVIVAVSVYFVVLRKLDGELVSLAIRLLIRAKS